MCQPCPWNKQELPLGEGLTVGQAVILALPDILPPRLRNIFLKWEPDDTPPLLAMISAPCCQPAATQPLVFPSPATHPGASASSHQPALTSLGLGCLGWGVSQTPSWSTSCYSEPPLEAENKFPPLMVIRFLPRLLLPETRSSLRAGTMWDSYQCPEHPALVLRGVWQMLG